MGAAAAGVQRHRAVLLLLVVLVSLIDLGAVASGGPPARRSSGGRSQAQGRAAQRGNDDGDNDGGTEQESERESAVPPGSHGIDDDGADDDEAGGGFRVVVQPVGRRRTREESYSRHTASGNWTKLRRINALLISLPRSASTTLGMLVNAIPGAYHFFEPFHNFPPDGARSMKVRYAFPPSPSLIEDPFTQLYDCSYLEDPTLAGPIHWKFKQAIDHDQSFRTAKCNLSWLRVIKTVRFRGYVANGLDLDDPNLRAVHLVRSPVAVVLSRMRNHWLKAMTLQEIVDSTCTEHGVAVERLSHLPPERFLRLRMETAMVRYPPNTAPHHSVFAPFVPVFDFLGVPRELWNNTDYINRRSKSITDGTNRMSVNAISKPVLDLEVLGAILKHKFMATCAGVMRDLGYTYESSTKTELDLSLSVRSQGKFFIQEQL